MGIVRTAAGLLFILTACRADTILLNSGVSVGGWNSVTGTNVLIEAHPVWAVTPEARWISYANTGYGGTVATNAPGETPTATFYQDFYMTVDTNRAVGNITVWADDTASVFLDGTLLLGRSFEMGLHCTATGIGCVPGHGVNLQFDILGDFGSKHTFQFDVYQQGGGPFGLMYAGSAELSDPPAATPEPGSLGALAGMLAAGAVIIRKRKQPSSCNK